MLLNNKYYYKKILIIGFGETGKSIAKFLSAKKCKIFFWDDNNKNNYNKKFKKICPKELELNYYDFIFVSPGVSKKHFLVKKIISKGIHISTDIELFLYSISNLDAKIKLIAITGTNGKSTVAMMIAKALNTKPLGNYGNLVLDNLNKINKNVVVELSSFQLDYINKIRPSISVITNIKPDHISHHGNFKNYKNTKFNITKDQKKNDYLILNYDDLNLRRKYNNKKSEKLKIIWVSNKNTLKKGISLKNKKLVDNYFDYKSHEFKENIFLKLEHNRLNFCIAFAALKASNMNANTIFKKILNFKGLPHRIEFIGKVNKTSFYNDSKATNVAATCSALESFDKVILIAGGSKKGENYKPLTKFTNRIFAVFLFGETAKDIGKVFGSASRKYFCKDMTEAVRFSFKASEFSKNNYPVLLSPASASYGLYKNFKKRGEHFKNIFKKLREDAA